MVTPVGFQCSLGWKPKSKIDARTPLCNPEGPANRLIAELTWGRDENFSPTCGGRRDQKILHSARVDAALFSNSKRTSAHYGCVARLPDLIQATVSAIQPRGVFQTVFL